MKFPFKISCLSLSLVAYSVTPASIDARTWRVTPDGTGDAPSIEAAMDSAAAFDTVLVAPGEHVITDVEVADGIFLIGEEGPFRTRLVPYPHPAFVSRLACGLLYRPTEISGLWLDGLGITAIIAVQCVDITVKGCVFTNNYAGIQIDTDFGRIRIEGNTFVDNTLAIDIYLGGGACLNNIIWDPNRGLQKLDAVCNDVLRLEDVAPMWRFANFSLDPEFCGENDYRIMASSPCAPGNTPLRDDCGLIGALPVNCAPSTVEKRTWGQIKALYRK